MTHTTRAPLGPDDSWDRAFLGDDAWDDDVWGLGERDDEDEDLWGGTWWDDGEPWPREDGAAAPWFLPPTSSLLEEEEIDDLEWIRQAEEIPFVQRCRMLRDFVGEGRPLTDSGVLPNAAVRELKQRGGILRPGGRLRDVPELLGPWIVLLDLGVLVVDDETHRVRRCSAGGVADACARDEADEPLGEWGGEIDGVLAIAELLYLFSVLRPVHGGFLDAFLVLEALLAATCENGLMLPEMPRDGCLDDAAIARLFRDIGANPAITRNPIDERRGELDLRALDDLAHVQLDLARLQAYGILGPAETGPAGTVYLAPRPVRTAVALLVLRRQQEKDARQEMLARLQARERKPQDPGCGRWA